MEDKKYEYLDKIQTMETERLILKKATEDDYKILGELLMDPEVTKYLHPDIYKPFESTNESICFLKNYKNKYEISFDFAVSLKDSGTCIGYVDFFISKKDDEKIGGVGTFFGREFWKKGFAKEALWCLIEKMFLNTDKISTLEYAMNINNSASLLLFSRLFVIALKKNKNLNLEVLLDSLNKENIRFFFKKS